MGVRGGGIVLATTVLGLATAALLLRVDPPEQGVVLDAAVSVAPDAPPLRGPGSDVIVDASALLGGRPSPADLAATTSVGFTGAALTVRARAATTEEAAVVARALAVAASRRLAAAGPGDRPANRPAVVIAPAEPRPTGPQPHPGLVLAAGALVGLLPGLVALRLPDAGSGRLPRSGRDPVAITPGTGRRHARRLAATREVAGSLRAARVIAVVDTVERSPVSAAVEIATALAADGARVLLVEGGPRSPSSRVRRVADPSPGAREVIAGVAETDRAIRPWARGGLDVLPTGRSGPPLADDDVAAVLEPLRGRYDHVVLDAPSPADLTVTVRGTRVDVGPSAPAPGHDPDGASESRRPG